MNRHVPLAAALLLCLPLLALGQESKSADEVAIRQVVQLYIDGAKNNEAGRLNKSLHPRGKWFFPSYIQDLEEVSQGRVVENTMSNLRKGIRADNVAARIASIDVTNDVAVVKVEFARLGAYLANNKGDLMSRLRVSDRRTTCHS